MHGSCPTVGVAGFTLGGGYGFDARRFGLACDTLVAAQAVDLRTLRPGAADADLLTGLRGAGASLAPVTALQLRTHAVGPVTTFFAAYPWSRAAEIVRAFSARCAAAPAPLGSICSLSTGAGSAGVQVFGQYLGTGAPAIRAIAALLEPGAKLTQATHGYLDAQLLLAGCRGKTLAQCRPQSEGGTLGSDTFAAGSAYVARTLSSAQARAVTGVIDARQAAGGSGVLPARRPGRRDRRRAGERDLLRPPRPTQLRTDPQLRHPRGHGRRPGIRGHGLVPVLAPLGDGEAYQNYPDANLRTWRTAYYGKAYGDLAALKRERDPERLLRFPQAVGS